MKYQHALNPSELEESMVSLAQKFFDYFEIFYANTQALKEVAYRIRYEVYCDELGYEDAEAFPNQQEKDAADDFSHHYLLRHKATGIFAGTVRVIHPMLAEQKSCIEHPVCLAHIIDQSKSPALTKKGSFAEVSRLAVPAAFRRRYGEFFRPEGNADQQGKAKEDERRMYSHIALGLYLAAIAHIQLDRRIHHAYIVTERALGRHLKQKGIDCEQIGPLFDYHGKRAAFYGCADSLSKNMTEEVKAFYTSIYHILGGYQVRKAC